MYLLRKSQIGLFDHHVGYDRVNQSGTVSHVQAKGPQPMNAAMVHVSDHKDPHVRRYAVKLKHAKNLYELHKLRSERFRHIPVWNKLTEHTQHRVQEAEQHIYDKLKAFEKEGPDHDRIDESGWNQQRMFKSSRVRHVAYILRKSMGRYRNKKRTTNNDKKVCSNLTNRK